VSYTMPIIEPEISELPEIVVKPIEPPVECFNINCAPIAYTVIDGAIVTEKEHGMFEAQEIALWSDTDKYTTFWVIVVDERTLKVAETELEALVQLEKDVAQLDTKKLVLTAHRHMFLPVQRAVIKEICEEAIARDKTVGAFTVAISNKIVNKTKNIISRESILSVKEAMSTPVLVEKQTNEESI